MAAPKNENCTSNYYSKGLIGPNRTKASWKPRVIETPLTFMECPECHTIYTMHDSHDEIQAPGKGRDKILMPPLTPPATLPTCCGHQLEPIPFIEHEDCEDRFILDYMISGGVNMNCVNVQWTVKDYSLKPRWATLKTFTGSQTKYIMPDKFSPLRFALSDEDAFTYCTKHPCPECSFRCKGGFEIYMYVEGLGIVHYSMNRISQLDMKRNV